MKIPLVQNFRATLATSILTCLIGSSAFAGGISGGGGGVTNPKSTSKAAIESAVTTYGRLVLLSWFQAQEANPTVFPAGTQADQLTAKLFRGSSSIYNVLASTAVEFHEQSPCKDGNGLPKDASSYADLPNRICMSLFAMAPKLNE